jgi:hypothetical protein
MDTVFNSVIFAPQCGGQHLALMLSSAYIQDRNTYLNIYDSMTTNVDEWSSFYGDCPIKCYHVQNFTTNYTKFKYPYQRVFLMSVPKDKETIAFKRMVHSAKFMDNLYFVELCQLLYHKQYISKMHDIPEHHIHTVNTEDFFRADIGTILHNISQHVPIDVKFCQTLHSIWFGKILNNIQT